MYKNSSNILIVDLESRDYQFKSTFELNNYIGGEALSNFLLKDYLGTSSLDTSYISVTTGPLNGIFPYTSKAIVTIYKDKSYKHFIGGGSVGPFLNFSNLKGIKFLNKSESPLYIEIVGRDVRFIDSKSTNLSSLGLSGRRSRIEFKNQILCDQHFSYGELGDYALGNNLLGFVFSPEGEINIKDTSDYQEVRDKITSREKELLVLRGSNPSCYGCPMGCALSKNSESLNVSILPRSLVSCAYAEPIYNDIDLVFSCFQVLGLPYNHEFLEEFSYKAGEVTRELSSLLETE